VSPGPKYVAANGARLVDVVSIQSQVAYGGVGNSIAVPALLAMGLQVAPVPTAVLGNTPHYPTMHGGPLPQDWFEGILDDLEAREAATRASCVLVGYLGSPAQGVALARWLRRMRQANAGLLVVVDPVIGDHDTGSYTDPALLPVWRDHLLSCADGLTPNHYELEQLCGRSLHSLQDCSEAASGLLGGDTRWIVVTSAAPRACPPGRVQLLVVADGQSRLVEHDEVAHAVKGGGDLFSALLAGRLVRGMDLVEAVTLCGADVAATLEQVRDRGWSEIALPYEIARRLG